MKYVIKPEIVIDVERAAQARNVILRILAAAELEGKIYHFQVPEATQK